MLAPMVRWLTLAEVVKKLEGVGIRVVREKGTWISQTCEGFHPLTHSALERVDRNGKDSRDTFVLHPWRHSPHGVSLASFR